MSHLVLVGAGHLHLGLLGRLPTLKRAGHEVTLISESSTYCYSGMAPGVLGGRYEGSDITVDIEAVTHGLGIRFIPQKVVHIDPIRRRLTLAEGATESYDIVSFNIGSVIPVRGLSLDFERTVLAKPILNFLLMRERVEVLLRQNAVPRVVVVGGGPAGLEIASNLRRLADRNGESLDITIICSGRLLPSLPRGARHAARRALLKSDIGVQEHCRLDAVEGRRVRIREGADQDADLVIAAVGVAPQDLFRHSGLPVSDDGGLQVNGFLQSPAYPEVFGGGDCVSPAEGRFPRIGVVACRQNPVVAHNLRAALEKKPLTGFRLRSHYLQIFNLGNERALMTWGRLWFSGRLAFRIKNAIDTRFIRRLRRSLQSGPPQS